MKKLVFKGLLVLLILAGILGVLMVTSINPLFSDKLNLLTNSGGYANFGNDEVESVLNKIDGDYEASKLILGDSVAAQLLSETKAPGYLVATGNQSMTFIWQYIFTQRFLDNHPGASDIYIVITPDSLSSVWNIRLSYQYVVMPLIKYDYIEAVDKVSYNELENIYGDVFMKESVISFIDKSGINRKLFLNGLAELNLPDEPYPKDSTKVSRVPNDYLLRIYTLCESHGVRMHLVCCPVMDTEENHSNIDELTKNYLESDIGRLFPNFFDGIMYYPEDMFKDPIHFKDNILTHEFKREIIDKMKENTGEFTGL